MRKLYKILKLKQKLNKFGYLDSKSLLTVIIIAFFLIGILFSAFYWISSLSFSSKTLSSLESENQLLKSKIKNLTDLYANLDRDFKKLRIENSYLRTAANLPQLSEDEIALGTGGSVFESSHFLKKDALKDLDELTKYAESLVTKLKFEKSEYQKISHKLKENEILFASMPAIKPCQGIIGLNGFGMREHPILGINKMHEGIDIVTDVGTKVYSTGNGIVTFVGVKNGYGLTVEIDHPSGYKTVYAHLLGALVKEGQKVSRGKLIAMTGNSGLSTGPHLHYEVHHNGIKLDPAQFFFDDLALFEQKQLNTKTGFGK